MAAILELPSQREASDDEISGIIESMLIPALLERNRNQIGWMLIDGYMQGVREFGVRDFQTGDLQLSWESEDGEVHMRWEEVLTLVEIEIGRLSRLDLSPLVKKRRHTLESLRGASLSQAVLYQTESSPAVEAINQNFLTALVLYGTCGIASWGDPSRSSPLAHERELIPPWELLSFPADYSNPTDRQAIVRTRLHPLRRLSKTPGVKLPTNEGLLEIVELPYGSKLRTQLSNQGTSAGGGGGFTRFSESLGEEASGRFSKESTAKRKREVKAGIKAEKFVVLREVFTDAPDGRVGRYIARAGRAIVQDVDYIRDGFDVPHPIGIGRYHDINRFYGRSFASKIIPLAMELENLIESIIQDAADLDRFGFLLVPNTLGIDNNQFFSTDKPKIVSYEPDLGEGRDRIDTIVPNPITDVPGRTSQFGLGLIDRTTAQGPLLRGDAPGRAESGESFNILGSSGSTHLVPIAKRIESAYGTMYRSLLYTVRRNLASFNESGSLTEGLSLIKIENAIAGVKIDPTTGKIRLESVTLPDPFELDIGIQSRDPEQRERRRSEGVAMRDRELLSPLEFIIMNYKEDWGFPIGNKAVWENYVKAVLLNLMMFNDGVEPGDIPNDSFFNPSFDKAEVHLLAVDDFVSGPEFSLASPEVRLQFDKRISELKIRLGIPLPPGQPVLEDAAVQSQQGRAALEGLTGQVEAQVPAGV